MASPMITSALPVSRRAILTTAPAAALLVTTAAALPAPALADHPDAGLLAAVRARLEHAALTEAFGEALAADLDARGVSGEWRVDDHPDLAARDDEHNGMQNDGDAMSDAIRHTAPRTVQGLAAKLLAGMVDALEEEVHAAVRRYLGDALGIVAPGALALVEHEPDWYSPAGPRVGLEVLARIEATFVMGRA